MLKNYLVKCKFIREFTDGTVKRVTEPYIIQAVSFSDAEERAYKEVGEYVRGEFHITAISIQNIQDVFFYDDTDLIFKVGIGYVSENPDTGKERSVSHTYLVNAHKVEEATKRMHENMKGLLAQYEIGEVKKTKIVDVFFYEPESDKEE
jgi:Domain of unknown function (DUF4494)